MLKFLFLPMFFMLLSCKSVLLREPASSNRPPQFVLLAFDGSKSLSMWKETREFARQNNIKFTYFVSGVYFIPSSMTQFYAEPKRGLGKSAIGWGNGKAEINSRYQQVIYAIQEGHEIASHANGHFDGASYTPMEWSMELRQFKDIVRNGWELVGRTKPAKWWGRYFDSELIGFRAPQLGHNPSTIQALAQNGYRYDTSKSDQMSYWPKKINNIWNFPLAGLRISRTGKRTLSMDYNFYVADSSAKKSSSDKWPLYEDRMFETYMKYFNNNYYGNRAPIDIGHHFSKWNGGAYWSALKRFAKEVCAKPEVRCVTYSDLADFLDSKGTEVVKRYQQGSFGKLSASSNTKSIVDRKIANSYPRELTRKELDALVRELPPIPHDDDKVNGL